MGAWAVENMAAAAEEAARVAGRCCSSSRGAEGAEVRHAGWAEGL